MKERNESKPLLDFSASLFCLLWAVGDLMALWDLRADSHCHWHTHTHTHTHFPTQSETDWLLGVPFVATGRSKKPAVDRKERVCLHLGLILGWDPLQETLRRSWGTGLQSECAGESPGDMVQMKVRVGFWAGA